MNAITKFVQDNGRTPTQEEVAAMMKQVAREDVQAFRKRWGTQIVHPEDHKKKSVEGKHVKAERHAAIIRMTKEGYTQKQIAEHLGINQGTVGTISSRIGARKHIQLAIEMIQEGFTNRAIAKELGMTHQAVQQVKKRYAVKGPRDRS
jgi:DNA-binding NarL/FixJ family response regulator